MMEAAGNAVVEAILSEWPQSRDARLRTWVLCGPGNNGGDGFVIARLLHLRGWPVEVFAQGDSRTAGAREMRDRWRALGPVRPLDEARGSPELLIDALLGFGRPRPFALPIVPDCPRIVAVDMATGLDTDTGVAVEPRLRADLTVTFHAAKPGHYLADGPSLTGHLVVADLGLAPDSDLHLGQPSVAALRKTGGHKYDYGHAVVMSGPPIQGGAARMAARAALRIGAGLVTLLPPERNADFHTPHLNAIMLRTADDAEEMAALLDDPRINAICAGPGLGVQRAEDLLPTLLAAGRATVLDADALTALGEHGLPALHDRCVLTPHQGEFGRLFPDLAKAMMRKPEDEWPLPKPDAVRMAAQRAGCTVLLKGHDTVIADPQGCVVLVHASHDRAAPWLATAGAGDVLAGLITGLLARGLSPFDAARTGAWVHIACARRFGPGLIAEDLPEQLPFVLRDLGL